MEIKTTGATDTATLVLFDPLALASRESEESDWWTGEGDLEREEARRGLAFVETGSDGAFELVVSDRFLASLLVAAANCASEWA